jgi:Ca-activated chloride channel family protein
MLTPSVVWIDRGADILFVLDCSPSMAALDIAGKRRFDAACELITDFSRTRPADAIGLVAVGNDAALLIPPTTDRNALFEKLSSLRIGELGDGTALGMGLSVAALHIKDSAAPRRAVVLITDGENNAGAIHPETAATIIAESGASLYIIAVGTSGEVPIDYIDPFTNTRRTGSFDSHYDPSALMSIADSGGGVFIPAPSKEAFSNAFARFSNAEITVSRSGVREKKSPVHTALIIAGTLFVAAGFIVKKIALGAFL